MNGYGMGKTEIVFLRGQTLEYKITEYKGAHKQVVDLSLLPSSLGVTDVSTHSFVIGTQINGAVSSRMLDFHAIHLARMKMFKEAGVLNLEIIGVADDRQCPECKKIDGKLYKLEDAPELPYAKCTCEMGCRCMLVAEDKFWKSC